ncbi:MAG: hypothetical protein LBJ20_04130 [Candidatus Methanoplasma sp.]|jgi:hypothetical protein|nr:hypothetical protein [Candidatus Methanoplasma sp.]
MDIPALYSVFRGGEVMTAPTAIEGSRISFASEPARPEYSAGRSEERMPIVVADIKGLGRKKLDDRLLTGMKFPGNDIWFMTHIEDVEDLFDCFMGNITKVLMPYHTVRNDLVTEEAYDVSDSCIPVVFVSGRRAICRENAAEDLEETLGKLEKIGFLEISIFDTDCTINREDWSSLYKKFRGIIPYVTDRNQIPEDIRPEYIIYGSR